MRRASDHATGAEDAGDEQEPERMDARRQREERGHAGERIRHPCRVCGAHEHVAAGENEPHGHRREAALDRGAQRGVAEAVPDMGNAVGEDR